jgi:hypothetical protein
LPHVHHWMIEVANGTTSHGVCRLCGAEKEFANSPPEGDMYNWSKLMAAKAKRKDDGDNYPSGTHILDSLPT